MKKSLSLLFASLAMPMACVVPTTITSCSKFKVNVNADSHIKNIKITKEYNKYFETDVPKKITYSLDDGYQLKSCKITINVYTTQTKGPRTFVMEFDDTNVINIPNTVYESHATDNAIRIDMVSTQVKNLSVQINNASSDESSEGKFIVEKTSDVFKSNKSYTIKNITSKKYNGLTIHNIYGLVGTINFINSSGEKIASRDLEYTTDGIVITNKEICSYLDSDIASISVNLESADLDLHELGKTTWEKLAEIASQPNSIEIAKKYFNPGDSLDITLNDISHKVRIVDMGVDTIAGSSNKATFTFEFVTPYTETYGDYTSRIWESNTLTGTNYNYSTSAISNFLNGNFKTKLVAGLGNAQTQLKTIDKTFLSGNESLNYTKSSFSTNVFLPSVVNVVSKAGVTLCECPLDIAHLDMIRSESDFQYSYYANTVGTTSIYEAYKSNRVRKYIAGSPTNYAKRVWLSTPYPGKIGMNTGKHACNLCEQDKSAFSLTWYNFVTQSFAVCPCFCF